MLKPTLAIAATLAGVVGATAASDDAWAEFAKDVDTACRAATAEVIADPTVTVDPFGSETYGLAVVSGETFSIVCVYDKKTKAVEIGGELPIVVTPSPTEG